MAEYANMQELEKINDLGDYELDFMKRKVVGVVFGNFKDASKNVKDNPDNVSEGERARILGDLYNHIVDYDIHDELFYFAWYRMFDPLGKRDVDEWQIEFGRHPFLKDMSDRTLKTTTWEKEWDTVSIDVVRLFKFPVKRPTGNVSISDGVKIARPREDANSDGAATNSKKTKTSDGDSGAANTKKTEKSDGDSGASNTKNPKKTDCDGGVGGL